MQEKREGGIIRYLLALATLFTALFGEVFEYEYKTFIDSDSKQGAQYIYDNRERLKDFSAIDDSFGLRTDTAWVYIKATNNTHKNLEKIITFPFPVVDYVNFYEIVDNTPVLRFETGEQYPFDTRDIKTNNYSFAIQIKSSEKQEYLVRIKTEGALHTKFALIDREQFDIERRNNGIFLGGYYGAVSIMLLYNLLLFFMIKERLYLYYVIFHGFYFLTSMAVNGHAFMYLYPSAPLINNYIVPLSMSLTSLFSLIFISPFLELKRFAPRVERIKKYLVGFSLVVIVLVLLLPYNLTIKLAVLLSNVSILFLFLSAFYVMQKHKTKESKYFLFAWTFILLGVVGAILQNTGILSYTPLLNKTPQIGAFIELSLLSFILATRYNDVMNRLRNNQRSLEKLNKDLEATVAERTNKLDMKNSELRTELSNKEMLLRELFHRVKNNLQIISSILSLHSANIINIDDKEVFTECIQRLKTISLLHEKLYLSHNLQEVDLQEYISEIVQNSHNSSASSNIVYKIVCHGIVLDSERSVPLGLIINELIINANKHAFDGVNKKKITITMQEKAESYCLTFSDNGKGIDEDTFCEGFGFKIIESLAVFQLGGTLDYFNKNGLHHAICIPKESR